MRARSFFITLSAMLMLSSAAQLAAQSSDGPGFTVSSLHGVYGVRESGDGTVAVGLGVVEYDGVGGAVRRIKVNAPDGNGGRRLLVFESTGAYTVNPDGTGTVTFTNTSPNPGAVDTFDFVITGSGMAWLPRLGRSRVATEIFAAQRESGVTVSLVTSIHKRLAGASECASAGF